MLPKIRTLTTNFELVRLEGSGGIFQELYLAGLQVEFSGGGGGGGARWVFMARNSLSRGKGLRVAGCTK